MHLGDMIRAVRKIIWAVRDEKHGADNWHSSHSIKFMLMCFAELSLLEGKSQ